MKGEIFDEIIGVVKVMCERVNRVEYGFDWVFDICGIGGDGVGTFNIFTMVSFVCAGVGVRIGKYGNCAISSCFGSVDVFEVLGVTLFFKFEELCYCLEIVGLVFLFVFVFYLVMKYVVGL